MQVSITGLNTSRKELGRLPRRWIHPNLPRLTRALLFFPITTTKKACTVLTTFNLRDEPQYRSSGLKEAPYNRFTA